MPTSMATASRLSPAEEELRIVLLGQVRAGKNKVVQILQGGNQPEEEIGSCIIREGEAAGRKISLVDTPEWDRHAIHNTPQKIKNEIIRSATLCPPGPHVLIVVLRVESLTDAPSAKELETMSQHMELLSERAWKHTMLLFLCDEDVEDPIINEHIQNANRLLGKCANRLCVLRSEAQIPEFLHEIDKMVEGNCGDCFLPQIYYDYMQSRIPHSVKEMKKSHDDREEEQKRGNETKIRACKKQAEEAALRHRRQSFQCEHPSLDEDDQTVDSAAAKSKYLERSLRQHYLRLLALIALVIIGAFAGSVSGSAFGVIGSVIGSVIGAIVTSPLAMWLSGATTLTNGSSDILQKKET